MKYQKNTIYCRRTDAFSLMELIIAVTLATFLISFVFWSVLVIYRGLHRAEDNSNIVREKALFFKIIADDILNTDIFPHHPSDKYVLKNNEIAFFANGGKVDYLFDDKKFRINREKDNKDYTFEFIKDFSVSYYDRNGYKIFNFDDFPYYCELKFVMNDNREIKLNLRL